jgi:hypothetical protein
MRNPEFSGDPEATKKNKSGARDDQDAGKQSDDQ